MRTPNCISYFTLGTGQIRQPWPFLGFWRGLGLWPQFFALNQQKYVVFTCHAKNLSHSSPHMLKTTKPNYLTIVENENLISNQPFSERCCTFTSGISSRTCSFNSSSSGSWGRCQFTFSRGRMWPSLVSQMWTRQRSGTPTGQRYCYAL